MRITICLAACLLIASAHAGDAAPALPDWIAGHWCGGGADERMEEQWLAPAGALMLGVSRSEANARPTQFEFLRIELTDDVPVYVAQPQGGAATRFTRSDAGADWIRFSNPEHDFPQHIEYRRAGEQLRASIRGPGEDGKEFSIDFDFKRCPG